MKRKSKYRFGAEWAAAMKTNYRYSDIVFKKVTEGNGKTFYTATFWHLEHDKWVPTR